jgi:hypothetical protein
MRGKSLDPFGSSALETPICLQLCLKSGQVQTFVKEIFVVVVVVVVVLNVLVKRKQKERRKNYYMVCDNSSNFSNIYFFCARLVIRRSSP